MAQEASHVQQRYLPHPDREGIALCLSGGGFRSVAFHLGAVRRLNELGILSKVDTITSVSGGSWMAAHLATTLQPWPNPGEVVQRWDAVVAEPLRRKLRRNWRFPALVRGLSPRISAVQALASNLRKLTKLTLGELPAPPNRPRFILGATDMVYGRYWTFEHDGMGVYNSRHRLPYTDWPLASAVAASSCLPPLLQAMPIPTRSHRLSPEAADSDYLAGKRPRLNVADGGIYDNLALEPVFSDHRTLLVSDGGAGLERPWNWKMTWRMLKHVIWRIERPREIHAYQSRLQRKAGLLRDFNARQMEGTYWSIGSKSERYPGAPQGYSAKLVQGTINQVRVDADALSAIELKVLENHGYLLADAAIRGHVPDLIAHQAAPRCPHQDVPADEDEIARQMAGSDQMTLFGHFR